MKHTCHAIGCEVGVPPRMLMCRRHWGMVPRQHQRRVWATYRTGQEIRKDPTTLYLIAHYDAVIAVAEKEGLSDHAHTVQAREARRVLVTDWDRLITEGASQ